MSPPGNQRGREAARRRAAQLAAREAQMRRRRRLQIAFGIVGLLGVALIVVAQIPQGSSTNTSATNTSTTATTVKAAAFKYGTGECAPASKPSTPKRTFTAAPKDCLKKGVDYKARMQTSEGAITFDLLEKTAPGTVNNFVNLARWGFFDGLTFHRIVPGFVIQGGDPKGTGSGGPGYSIADELPSSVSAYKTGAVAMANSGPNTNGSQFFICVECATQLQQPLYSLFGQVLEGQDVVQKIDALGTSDGPPSKPVLITDVTILEG